MKKLIKLLLISANIVLAGCYFGGFFEKEIFPPVEQYIIDQKICTVVWWNKNIAWTKYRPVDTSKDTLRKDSLEAERIYKTIQSLK